MAVPLGGSVALLLQLRALRKIGYPVRLLSPKGVGAVKKLFLLMLPSILSASVYQILVFINTLLASLLEEGSVSWLYFADRVFQFPLGVFSLAVATAVLPTLSRLASANKSSELQQRIDRTLGWITFITVPATIGLIILSQPIVSSIFEYGHFDSNDSAKTAAALKAYAIGLWPISCQAILVRCYLAKKNSIIPAVISSCTLVFNIYFAFALMGPPSASAGALVTSLSLAVWESLGIAALGHTGLALASSISTSITMIGLLLFIHKVDLYPNLGLLIINVFRSVLAGLAMGLVVWGLACYMTSDLFMMLVSVPMGALCYFATAKLLQAPQADEVLAFARRKLQSFSH
jgi:putative peptidoglycan lipid II flippase